MRLSKYSVPFIFLLMVNVLCYAQPKPKSGGVVGEYLQFKAMADAAFDDGNFEKAQRLFTVCLEMVSGDEYAAAKLSTCQELNNGLKQLEAAIKTNNQALLKTVLNNLKSTKSYSSQTNLLKNRVLLLLEKEADQRLKNGDLENAVRLYTRTHELLPASGLTFKMERANLMYLEKYKKNMEAYADFQKSRKLKNQLTLLPTNDEAESLRKKADDFFAKGEWDKAQKLYNAALVLGEGKRPDIEQRLVDIANNKRLDRQKAEADEQSNFGLSAKIGEEMLKSRPTDAQLKSNVADNYQKLADKYYGEGSFANARDYYRKANETEPNAILAAKIDDTEKKIAEIRLANSEKRKEVLKTPSSKKSQKGTAIVGMGVVAGLNYLQPTLTNGSTPLNAVRKLGWHAGLQVILMPESNASIIVGGLYNTNRFYVPNADKTAKIEDLSLNTLQLSASFRLQKSLGSTDSKVFVVAGLGYNKPINPSYQNYLVDKSITSANSFSTGFNYNVGLGLSKAIGKRQALSFMISYDGGMQNAFTSTFKDGSANKGMPSLILSNLKCTILLKIF